MVTTITKSSADTTPGTAASAALSTGPGNDDLGKQIERIKADIGDLTRLIGEYGLAEKDRAAAALRARAADVKSSAEHAAKRAQTEASQLAHRAEDAVREQPVIALGLVAGLGFLVGALMTRR